jgi:glycosyltransferase involved in cell wall biosynthesis
MRVTIIPNGFQVNYIVDLVNGLISAGCEVELLGSSIYPADKINNSVIFKNIRGEHDSDRPMLEKIRRNISYYRKLIKYINSGDVDMVHIQWLNIPILDGVLIPVYFRMAGIRCCYTVHDVLPHSKDNLFYRALYSIIYRTQNRLIVHTDHIRSRLINEFRLSGKVISVVRHGVYTHGHYAITAKEKARTDLNLPTGEKIILFFGHITAYKGLAILLEACTLIKKSTNDLRLIIAGRVADDYKDEFSDLTGRYASEWITILPGHIEDHIMHKLFSATDVTVLPYLEASQSGVMFMSYSFGRPVIVPDIGGFPDDIVPGRTGYLFKARDPGSLAETIGKFFENLTLIANPVLNLSGKML